MTVAELIAELSTVKNLQDDVILADDGSTLYGLEEIEEHGVILLRFDSTP